MESMCCQDKLYQNKIGGPSKPFIDQNLQIQLPEWDSQQKNIQSSHSPIYSHYVGCSPSDYYHPPLNELELHNAIGQAEQSYVAWKKMEEKLKEASQAYQKSPG